MTIAFGVIRHTVSNCEEAFMALDPVRSAEAVESTVQTDEGRVEDVLVEDVLVEVVSIDGMCGVY